MQMLIEDQKAVDITPYESQDEDGETHQIISAANAFDILDAWEKLAPGRRGIRSGRDTDDPEPSTIYVAEAQRNGSLEMFDIDPHYDGLMTHNAYRLGDFTDAFDMKVVA